MNRSRWLVFAAVLLLAWQAWHQIAPQPTVVAAPAPSSWPSLPARAPPLPDASAGAAALPGLDARGADGLPPEAHDTLRRIADGGPFPFELDGVVFSNFERQLPLKSRGYYREYTVPTPGLGHRGTRRIVTGGDPPESFYYTDNHYQSFRKIGGQP